MTKSTDYEKCVCCGRCTNIPKYMHVSKRSYYVEGIGQLCNECFKKIYHDSDISKNEMEYIYINSQVKRKE